MNNARELIDRYFYLAPRPDADAYFAQFAQTHSSRTRARRIAASPPSAPG